METALRGPIRDTPLTGPTPSFPAAATHDLRFRLGAEGAGVGGWDFDLRSKALFWSKTARKLFGVSDNVRVSYDFFLSLLQPDDRERTERAVSRTIETGAPLDLSFRIEREDGRSHWIRIRGSLTEDSGGTLCHLSGVVLDIDEEKHHEEDLRTRERHLQSILETVPDAMIVIDGKGIMQSFQARRSGSSATTDARRSGRMSVSSCRSSTIRAMTATWRAIAPPASDTSSALVAL